MGSLVRWWKVVAVAGLVTGALALLMPSAVAGGGGHCEEPLATGTGAHVEMVDACFTPAILTVNAGDEVRFTNRDDMAHNVAPAGWGWGHVEEMWKGDSFTATFDEPGVYPFVCSFHPGMTGTVIVEEPAASTATTASAGTGAAGGGSVDAIVAAIAGAAGGYVLARRRGRSDRQPYQPTPGA